MGIREEDRYYHSGSGTQCVGGPRELFPDMTLEQNLRVNGREPGEGLVSGSGNSQGGGDECHRTGPRPAWWSVALGTGGQGEVAEGRSYRVLNIMDLELIQKASLLWWHGDPQSC